MRYFAAFLHLRDPEKNRTLRPGHIAFLEEQEVQGQIFARGPFTDGTGGLVIYCAASLEEARKVAESDPYVIEGARELELHEWAMTRRA
jgi:uncharacterized protein